MIKTRKRKHSSLSSSLSSLSLSSSSVSARAKLLSGGRRRKGSRSREITSTVSLIPPRTKKVRAFTKKDFHSGDGMLTTVWGPSMWHFLHTMSFNYPVKPTDEQKRHYMDFILNLRNVLPCKYCRMNLTNNLATRPLKMCHMESRDTFSRFVYDLHETVNKLLGKNSGLSYCDVRERYEHFRSRCTQDAPKVFNFREFYRGKNKDMKEKGCTEPLYGKKAKCVISIVPQEVKVPTFSVDDQCIKKRGEVVAEKE
jgi:hypothetical protein